MENFTPLSALIGGCLIGLAATLMLWTSGRIAGISGILGGLLAPVNSDTAWRVCFLVGLIGGPLSYMLVSGNALDIVSQASPMVSIVAGLAVGFGTRLGSGCTSGHGICGIARFSARSFLATAVFMVSAIVTVYVTRHILGAS
ncbi:MAG: YeeE/YedE family protein [Pseudohongiellaceae bacterium]